MPLNDIDLVITVGDVSSYDPSTLAGYVSQCLTGSLNATNPWRSISLNSYSAAQDHGGYSRGRNLVSRRCWQLWNNVSPLALPFKLDYSDYGHIHPSLEEVPGYAMANATVSVRYAIDDNWVILKGTQVGGAHGSPMRIQYQGHATALIKESQFNKLSYCWGDDQIRHYATTTGGTGGRKEWVAVLLNRHISHVCDRLP